MTALPALLLLACVAGTPSQDPFYQPVHGGDSGADTAEEDPCAPVLPEGTRVLRPEDSGPLQGGGPWWICAYATASATAAGDYYLEPGASLALSADSARAWVKSRASLQLSGSGGWVAAEPAATLSLPADAERVDCASITFRAGALSERCD